MSQAAGWYRDPTGRYNIRYWDGQQWTDHTNSGGSNAVDPMPEEMRYVQPAPGTEAVQAAAAPAQPQPTMQVTQSSPSSAGTIVAVVLSVVAVLLVLMVLLTQGGDDETDTTEPVTTEAPATTQAPPEE